MIRTISVSLFSLLSALAVSLSLASCGTVAGFGEDLNRLGRKIESKADNEGTIDGFGEDLQRLGRKMERKSNEVYYGDRY